MKQLRVLVVSMAITGLAMQIPSTWTVAQEAIRATSSTLSKDVLVCGKSQPGAVGIEFVAIPAGTFQMGCSNGDYVCGDDELPVHWVTISKSFELGRHEVTMAQWKTVMVQDPRGAAGNNLPAGVSWNDVQEFLTKLNARNVDYRYRLPTEAEWEYAARAGTTGPHAGNVDEMAWYDKNSGSRPHPVGQKQANPCGLYDMEGNVAEWVEDWYGPYPSAAPTDPKGPPSGDRRVFRGGDAGNSAAVARVSMRSSWPPNGDRGVELGFRVVREAVR